MGKVSYTYIFLYVLTGFGPLFHLLLQGDEFPIARNSNLEVSTALACPNFVDPIFSDEVVCSGSFINPPDDPTILANVFPPESAFVVWDMDINAPVFNNNLNCQTIDIQYNYSILCTEDPTFFMEGGSHVVTVLPELQPPTILIDDDCNYTIIPHCPSDQVNPPVVDPSLPEQQFTVNNPFGCSQDFNVPTPPCLVEVFDIVISPICNQYVVDFMISGGTGTYVVNGILLPSGQTHFASSPIPCGAPYNFQVTDNIFTNEVIVSGDGPPCFPPLITSVPNITVIGLEFFVEFTISGGTGNYTVDGQPTGPDFVSALIPCGQPYSFQVSDGCETLTVTDGPVICYDPITTSVPEIIENCNQFQVLFTISGGTGNYVVNGNPLPPGQNSFLSGFLPCGSAYNFQVTDDLTTDIVTVSGDGPACLPPLLTSAPTFTINNGQYQVTFTISGGTGSYLVDGIPIAGNTFTSAFMDCSQPFNFVVSDNCETVNVSGDPPVCFDPITVSDPIVIQNCNQYQVSITISGGTGNYIVNGSALPPGQNTATSQLVPCGTSFFIQVTDDQGTDVVDINGSGSACLPSLFNFPPTIQVIGLQYQVTITIQGGTGNYSVDGQPIIGNTFVSDLISCGFGYNFNISDGCQTIFVAEPLVQCYPPITAEVLINTDCNEFQVTLFLNGGTGNYVINGIPLAPGQVEFVSNTFACESAYIFQITDDLGSDEIQIADIGPACFEELSVSPETFNFLGNQYQVTFTLSNGTGDYFVNGQAIAGNTFTSGFINCGNPYTFNVSDLCNQVLVTGESPVCLDPLATSEVLTGLTCNQFTAQFSLSGGSGDYAVNGIPIPGDLFISDFIDCGQPYNFDVTDNQTDENINLNGIGPDCFDPLDTSDVAIGVIGNQYTAQFTTTGGSGDYSIDGIPIPGDLFISDFIDCGQPYNFEVTDGCEVITVDGGPISCFDPLTTSDVLIGPICNQFTAQFSLSGGSGDYAINGIPIPGDLFISDLIDCGQPYNFDVTDNQTDENINLNGIGPDCFDPLTTSDVAIGIIGNQYTAQFTTSGGSGDYAIDGIPIPSDLFISEFIDCGQPFNFEVTDGCEVITVDGGPVSCFDPLTTSDVLVGPICNQFTAQFSLSGGSGDYAVNGIPIPGDLFISDLIDCGQPYNFDVTDNQTDENINLNGIGPDCPDPLTTSDVAIGVSGNQYTAQFTTSGGSGDYAIDGIPIPGDLFISDLIDCGQPYNFEVTDGCEVITVDGGPVSCFDPLTTSDVLVGPICNQFTAQFSLSGGSGDYAVNGIPIPGDLFISDLIDCGTPYNFDVTDNQTDENINLNGIGPDCPDPLTTSDVEIGVSGNQYTAQFTTSGGSGDYAIDGIPIPGDLFISDLIDCGQPYNFEVTDGCEVITVDGGPVSCFDPLTTSDVLVGPICNQFTAQFSLSGGSGDYAVNGIPIPGDLFISDLIDCGTPYNFDVTDNQTDENINLNGIGPDCPDPLTTSDVEIGVSGNQYTAQFTTSGGSGDYAIDGIPIPGDLFISDLLDCGTPYNFEVTDGCEVITVEGGPISCFDPLTTSDVLIGPICNQFTAQFSLSGGSGDYAVNGIPIPGDLFISDLIDCGQPYNFDVIDNQTNENINLSGAGPDCPDPLETSDVAIGVIGDQYTAQFTTSGGSGDYAIDGIPIPGDLFISEFIDCGQPYSFEVTDGCEVITVAGGPVSCLDPLTTSDVLIGPICNQFTAQFSLSGGSGDYAVNGIPIPGDLFISDLIDCGEPYNFDVTDNQTNENINLSGAGPDCPDPLETSDVAIGVIGDQYTAQFTTSGGSGDYAVDGIPIPGDLFISDLIDCGQPYNFEVTDGCEVITVAGGPVSCLDPLTTSDVLIGPVCNQFTAQFSLSGGSGDYAVNGIPIPGDLFISDLIDCGEPYNFEVTDNQTAENINLSGIGPDCPDPLSHDTVETGVMGNQYTAQFGISGGSGNYSVDGIPLPGDLFISELIDCGEPYSFSLADGCDTIAISGPAPCDPCPEVVGDFTDQIDQCHGDLPALPSDNDILATVDVPTNAIIEWSEDPNLPLEHPGGGCDPVLKSFVLSVTCATDTSVNLNGGVITISIYPEPGEPSIVLTDSTEMTCLYKVIPACKNDIIEPATLELPNGTTGATLEVTVSNVGCADGLSYTIPVPDCILVDIEDPVTALFDLTIHRNPFGQGGKLGIQFTLTYSQHIVLSIYDLNGRKVKDLHRQTFMEGLHYVEWDGSATNGHLVPAGMYMIELQTPEGRYVEKVIKYD